MLLWLMWLLWLLWLMLRLVTAALMVVATLLRLMLLRRLTMLRRLIAVLRRLLVGLLLLIRLLLAALAVAVAVILAAHLVVGGRHRPLLTHRVGLAVAAIGLHDPVIVLGMLIEILGGNAIARGGGFARHRDVAFEHLIRVTANLHARSAAVEILRTVRRTRPPIVGVTLSTRHVVIAATATAILLAWSHDSFEVAVHQWFKTLLEMSRMRFVQPFRATTGRRSIQTGRLQRFQRGALGSLAFGQNTLDGMLGEANLFFR